MIDFIPGISLTVGRDLDRQTDNKILVKFNLKVYN